MTPELRELYQEMILEHNKKPRNFRVLANATHHAEGYNPLCGDKLKLYLLIEKNVIKEVGFQGSGCAISKSSASMMTTSVAGRTKDEAEALFEKFHTMLAGESKSPPDLEALGKLAVFGGVREFPTRVKCATLAWHTLRAAIEKKEELVSTEKDDADRGFG
jgi:nitrogen fixation NifU-like protein